MSNHARAHTHTPLCVPQEVCLSPVEPTRMSRRVRGGLPRSLIGLCHETRFRILVLRSRCARNERRNAIISMHKQSVLTANSSNHFKMGIFSSIKAAVGLATLFVALQHVATCARVKGPLKLPDQLQCTSEVYLQNTVSISGGAGMFKHQAAD